MSDSDSGGGAQGVAMNLHHGFLSRDHEARMAVGWKRTTEQGVLQLDPHKPADVHTVSAPRRASWLVRQGLRPSTYANLQRKGAGSDLWSFPETGELLKIETDILQLHNLHSRYFDLDYLPQLTATRHTFLTLHDAWLLGGHCAHSFDCEEWRTGCTKCAIWTFPTG